MINNSSYEDGLLREKLLLKSKKINKILSNLQASLSKQLFNKSSKTPQIDFPNTKKINLPIDLPFLAENLLESEDPFFGSLHRIKIFSKFLKFPKRSIAILYLENKKIKEIYNYPEIDPQILNVLNPNLQSLCDVKNISYSSYLNEKEKVIQNRKNDEKNKVAFGEEINKKLSNKIGFLIELHKGNYLDKMEINKIFFNKLFLEYILEDFEYAIYYILKFGFPKIFYDISNSQLLEKICEIALKNKKFANVQLKDFKGNIRNFKMKIKTASFVKNEKGLEEFIFIYFKNIEKNLNKNNENIENTFDNNLQDYIDSFKNFFEAFYPETQFEKCNPFKRVSYKKI